ncbi:MAG: hypothetical protein JW702_04890 [Clostridiales bacterium]|nr:hypothetical protein [Clostridiales bacterium]
MQKDRIATLFGLDNFNKFVDGFTENFDKYLSVDNVIEKILQRYLLNSVSILFYKRSIKLNRVLRL